MFKFVLLCALIAAASAGPQFGKNPYGHHAYSGDEAHAEIKSLASDVRADGFQYAFDTTNNIHASASGDEHGNIHGDFSWISPEGVPVAVAYLADENGYQPNSDVLPTPPPVPIAILKSLEYIRTHPTYVEPATPFGHNAGRNNFGRHF